MSAEDQLLHARSNVANPNPFGGWQCGKPLRTGQCVLDADHRGRHTTVAFYCDCCGKMRRGSPDVIGRDINGDPDIAACWFCTHVTIPALQDRYADRMYEAVNY